MSKYFNFSTCANKAVLVTTIVAVAAAFGIPTSVFAVEQARNQGTVDFEGETTVCENGQPCEREQTICQPTPEACEITKELFNTTIPNVASPSFPFGN